MKQVYQKISGAILMLVMASVLVVTQSTVAAEQSPQQLVEQTTKDLFAAVKSNNAATKKTDAYYADVTKILDSVVDFPFIANAVMRKSGKAATPEQVAKFTAVFKNGLIRTYAKGIANYTDSTIKTLPVTAKEGAHRLTIEQEVTDKGTTHHLAYTMKQNQTGEWKLINVILNGVNLGDSFTSQFDQAMIKNNNDIDKVIDNWLVAN